MQLSPCSPLELYPRHWRIGLPYFTSCRRLRLEGSDQQSKIKSLTTKCSQNLTGHMKDNHIFSQMHQQTHTLYFMHACTILVLTSSVRQSIWSRICHPRHSMGLWPGSSQRRPPHTHHSDAEPGGSRPKLNPHTVVAVWRNKEEYQKKTDNYNCFEIHAFSFLR